MLYSTAVEVVAWNPPRRLPSTYRFSVFEADLATGELRKRGRKVTLQDQPFQVLALLLRRRGEIVTREELQRALVAGRHVRRVRARGQHGDQASCARRWGIRPTIRASSRRCRARATASSLRWKAWRRRRRSRSLPRSRLRRFAGAGGGGSQAPASLSSPPAAPCGC